MLVLLMIVCVVGVSLVVRVFDARRRAGGCPQGGRFMFTCIMLNCRFIFSCLVVRVVFRMDASLRAAT